MLKIMPINGITHKPRPILVRFLSKKLLDSFKNLATVKPSPHVDTKNKTKDNAILYLHYLIQLLSKMIPSI